MLHRVAKIPRVFKARHLPLATPCNMNASWQALAAAIARLGRSQGFRPADRGGDRFRVVALIRTAPTVRTASLASTEGERHSCAYAASGTARAEAAIAVCRQNEIKKDLFAMTNLCRAPRVYSSDGL
jgi:hypothetical protein